MAIAEFGVLPIKRLCGELVVRGFGFNRDEFTIAATQDNGAEFILCFFRWLKSYQLNPNDLVSPATE